MPKRRVVQLTDAQRSKLESVVNLHPKPYVRERAAAILKVANGQSAYAVARYGLLRERDPDTVYAWLERFEQEGIEGLLIKEGRGRKPSMAETTEMAEA
jgi:transposase